MIAAAIDIGSNSILLSIARLQPHHSLELLEDQCWVTGLAKGLTQGAKISPTAVEKTKEALSHYLQLIQKYKVDTTKVVATESLRKPQNAEEVRQELSQHLGLPIELISGQREAELSFLGVQAEHPNQEADKAVFDIGGASTELIFGNKSGSKDWKSLKMGSVLITEKFGLDRASDPTLARTSINELLHQELKGPTSDFLGIGVAGTMTSLLALEKGLKNFQRSAVHTQRISKDRVDFWQKKILSKNTEERKKIVGMPQERADVIAGGILIAQCLMEFFHWNEVTCMDSGVRFGLLYDLFYNEPTPKKI